ncbi:MAG: Na(+)/H(+)-K(+) antiporter GerN [bacterium]|nr:Na(+)/H(+)-K(+) antiporter GerN [bacterium]
MSPLLQLLLLLAAIIVVAKGAGILFLRFKQPAILGEILAGLVLGPTLLNLPAFALFAAHGDHGHSVFTTIHELAEIGVLLLMFIAGMETDLAAMARVGKAAFMGAVGGVIGPVVLGVGASLLLGGMVDGPMHLFNALFIATILAATSVSISAQTLLELGHLRSKEGTTILGAAVIDDVIGIVLVSVILAFHATSGSGEAEHNGMKDLATLISTSLHLDAGASIAVLLSCMALFFVGSWFLMGRLIPRLLAYSENLPTSQPLMAMVLFIAFLMAWGAEWIGSVAFITGSYVAGLLIAQTHYKHLVEERISTITYSLFVPVFFINIGLNADARPLFAPFTALAQGGTPEWGAFLFTVAICVVAVIAKVGGCYLGCLPAGFKSLEALRVGVGMISRGEVGLIIANIGVQSGIINQTIFSVMVVMVLVTTLVTPPLLKLVFSGAAATDDGPLGSDLAGIAEDAQIESIVGAPASAHENPYRTAHYTDQD